MIRQPAVRKSRLVLSAALAAASCLAFPALGAVQDPAVQDPTAAVDAVEVQRAYDRVVNGIMSPFCPGRTLHACPTNSAADVRREVRGWLEEGRSEQWVIDTLVQRYGEDVRGAPPFRGLGILGWLLVPVAGAVGVWIVVSVMRRRSSREPAPAAEAAPMGTSRDAAQARVEAEIAALLE